MPEFGCTYRHVCAVMQHSLAHMQIVGFISVYVCDSGWCTLVILTYPMHIPALLARKHATNVCPTSCFLIWFSSVLRSLRMVCRIRSVKYYLFIERSSPNRNVQKKLRFGKQLQASGQHSLHKRWHPTHHVCIISTICFHSISSNEYLLNNGNSIKRFPHAHDLSHPLVGYILSTIYGSE